MTSNLKQLKEDIKNNNFAKSSIILGLAALLVSCGGGGGGGGGVGNSGGTSAATPTPVNPAPVTTKPTVTATTSGIGWNSSTISYDKNNPHNNSNTALTGNDVKIGIIDVGFENSSFNPDLTEKFGSRLTKLTISGFTSEATVNDDHGIVVADLAAGSSTGIAKGASVYVIDAAKRNTDKNVTYPSVKLEMYQKLKDNGVTIYNQSFGIDGEVTDFNADNTSSHYYGFQIGSSMLDFYRNEVNNGSLFVWSAGNDSSDKQPTLEGGLPHFESGLQKGWINVVALTSKYESKLGDTSWDNLTPLSPAGVAKNWTVTAVGDQTFSMKGKNYVGGGSSFAAPIVTGTAALIKQKYPWMDADLIRQTILSTATDIGTPGVDDVYGWGLLNIDKALKGPALFSKQLALADNVTINIPSGSYVFSNDISGDAGVIKNGSGDLILSGNSTFTGPTTVNDGRLQVNGVYTSSINVKRQAILSTNNAVLKNDVINSGTLENTGSTEVDGNYSSLENSRIVTGLNSNIHVKGKVSLNNSKLEVKPEENGERKYITSNGITQNIITSDDKIEGNFNSVNTDEMLNAKLNQTENSVSAKVSRKNVLNYVEKLSESDEMQKNTAQNLETAFQKLDQDIENGTAGNVTQFERKAARLQALTSSNRAAVLDSLSGQIYASAQALTFQHSQTVNKDLSNRLVMLGTLDNVGDKFGLWISGLGANGKLKQDGYGKGDTKVYGGQVGVDKQFGENLILGTALSYSKADVKFDRYGGKSDANNFGISLYGRLGNKDIPVYLQGRLGIGFVDSDVERNIILSNNDYTRAKINHNDKVYSGYLETGYDVKNANGDFVVTPFVGLTHDTVQRGSFSEEKSQFGLTADKKNYNQTAALVGLRVGKAVNWKSGSKTTFQGYVTHQRAFNKQDLSFDARYTGLPGATFKVKGIGLAKNKTWAGVGALTEVNKDFGWYVNYDGSVDGGKGKGNNNVFTTGVRFNF
ncbi:autotransporter domain-containing protein [Leptotrichia wadei]|uniref:Outer membrane autotransporter barrel domain-containing protein n=1 Tax=Leptotrichia wadei TaxID=157687 RepID=A0A510KG60_9FUSO|nr:autotransporter domain-containing protein [Leptotrichia wadei]BBM50656.1 outer membrane autotransporter barrel domain-containing protein [Leptotrichia wadei]